MALQSLCHAGVRAIPHHQMQWHNCTRTQTHPETHTHTASGSQAQWLVFASPRQKNTVLLWRSLRPISLSYKCCTTLQTERRAHTDELEKKTKRSHRKSIFSFILLVTHKIWVGRTNLFYILRIDRLAWVVSFHALSKAIKNTLGQKWWPRIALLMMVLLWGELSHPSVWFLNLHQTESPVWLSELTLSAFLGNKSEIKFMTGFGGSVMINALQLHSAVLAPSQYLKGLDNILSFTISHALLNTSGWLLPCKPASSIRSNLGYATCYRLLLP